MTAAQSGGGDTQKNLVTSSLPNRPGFTPLHVACSSGAPPDVLTLLLEAGADPFAPVSTSSSGSSDIPTPLACALKSTSGTSRESLTAQLRAASFLLDVCSPSAASKAIHQRDRDGRTLFHLLAERVGVGGAAAGPGKPLSSSSTATVPPGEDDDDFHLLCDLLSKLLSGWKGLEGLSEAQSSPFRLQDATPDGATPMHRAAIRGHAAICQAMIDLAASIDPNSPTASLVDVLDARHRSPLHWASSSASSSEPSKTVAVLLSAGANPDLKDLYGETPLSDALSAGNSICALQLLAAGATPPSRRPSVKGSKTQLSAQLRGVLASSNVQSAAAAALQNPSALSAANNDLPGSGKSSPSSSQTPTSGSSASNTLVQTVPPSPLSQQPIGWWTSAQVAQFIRALSFSIDYSRLFSDCDGAVLLSLTDSDLERMGISSLPARRKIIQEVTRLQGSNNSDSSPSSPAPPRPSLLADRPCELCKSSPSTAWIAVAVCSDCNHRCKVDSTHLTSLLPHPVKNIPVLDSKHTGGPNQGEADSQDVAVVMQRPSAPPIENF